MTGFKGVFMLKLYIGNKNYSSWSMRPWVLLKQAGLEFDEVMVRFDSFEDGSEFKKVLGPINPVGKVPVLVDDGFVIWDTLAICEYVAEYAATKFPGTALWPRDAKARARARSLCAEMHSGLSGLRSNCPMNIGATNPPCAPTWHAWWPCGAPCCKRIVGQCCLANFALLMPTSHRSACA